GRGSLLVVAALVGVAERDGDGDADARLAVLLVARERVVVDDVLLHGVPPSVSGVLLCTPGPAVASAGPGSSRGSGWTSWGTLRRCGQPVAQEAQGPAQDG